MAPDADPGEEVGLREALEVLRLEVNDAPFVHRAWRDVAGGDEVAEPLGRVAVDLVVEGGHGIRRTLPGRTLAVSS
jgi:hypothetical protein